MKTVKVNRLLLSCLLATNIATAEELDTIWDRYVDPSDYCNGVWKMGQTIPPWLTYYPNKAYKEKWVGFKDCWVVADTIICVDVRGGPAEVRRWR